MPNTAPVPTPQPLPDTQPEHLDPLQRRRRRIRSLAALAWLLMLSVITVSAFIRLSQSGVGCADWPVCYEQAAGHASAHPWLGLARATHRVTASAMLLVVLGLLISIPIIVWGSQLVIKLMERFPLIITLGGMLLGWIAGGMLVTDPALANPDKWQWMLKMPVDSVTGEVTDVVKYGASVAGALLVLLAGKIILARRASAGSAPAGH